MYPEKIHHSQDQHHPYKGQERPNVRYQESITAVKKQEERAIFTQPTPRPVKRILLYDQNNSKMLFPLVHDRDVGIDPKYQKIVIQSYNDDDKQTSSTQMRNGMIQTLEDLYGQLYERSGR